MTARLVRHADPACVGGWSAVAEDVPPWSQRRPARLDLICWTCGRVVHVTASTPATDDPDSYRYDADGYDADGSTTAAGVPAEHRPGLAGLDGFDNTRRYPASVPPARVATGRGPARVVGLLYVESWLYAGQPDSAFGWLVTDLDGNQLGAVARTLSLRANAATRYEWGSLAGTAGHGTGFHSPEAATRALLRAVYDRSDSAPARGSDPRGGSDSRGREEW